jgi:hypothetical protein
MGQGVRFKKYEKKIHPYSGLDPVSWERFQTNIHTFERLVSTPQVEEAAGALYEAIESARDLGLGLRRADDEHHREDINKIANELGYEGEFLLNQNAISRGVYFFPKYLNESIMDYPEDEPRDFQRVARSHGQ